MRAALENLLARLQLLARIEDGVAAVEFALVLPIMLLVYIGSVEASAAISMDRRVLSITGALGDLVARSDTTIPAATLEDYFKAAAGMMTPYPADELRQEVSQIEVRADGTTVLSWCRRYVDDDMSVCPARTITLPAAITNISRGKFVIVAEAAYTYTPLYGFAFNQPIRLYRENFFMPRFGGTITIN